MNNCELEKTLHLPGVEGEPWPDGSVEVIDWDIHEEDLRPGAEIKWSLYQRDKDGLAVWMSDHDTKQEALDWAAGNDYEVLDMYAERMEVSK